MEIWDGDHLSELALSCLADAQDVIDPVARVHAESCATCMMRIGEMALESHDVGAALRMGREMASAQTSPSSKLHRFPKLLVASATAVAIACSLPAMLDALPRAVSWAFAVPRILPVVTTSLVALGKSFSAGPSGAAVSLVTTFTLALLGYAVARASSRHGASR
jgi:hypothetical protein